MLNYATDADREAASGWRLGQAIKVNAVQQSKRSVKFHGLYWAGLIELVFEYWEPDGGMTTEAERAIISKFSKMLDEASGGSEVAGWGDYFLSLLSQDRAQKIQAQNKTKKALHRWIKEKAGYFNVEITPTGPKRILKSINFNAMSQEEFNDYYKAAFDVCWRYVLAKDFESEEQAQNTINQLLSMG
jgi:hypothetical protein